MSDLSEKLDKFVDAEEKDKTKILNILTKEKERYKEISFNGESLRIRPTIPKSLRHKIQEIREKGEDDVDDAERDMYFLLSSMCIDSPFDKPEIWEFIDSETGSVIEVFNAVFKEASNTEESIKRFRKK